LHHRASRSTAASGSTIESSDVKLYGRGPPWRRPAAADSACLDFTRRPIAATPAIAWPIGVERSTIVHREQAHVVRGACFGETMRKPGPTPTHDSIRPVTTANRWIEAKRGSNEISIDRIAAEQALEHGDDEAREIALQLLREVRKIPA
jgi:hypothetical protein